MTKAYMEKEDNGFNIMLIDHADGSPEVCAAISCLAYTLAGWLNNQSIKVWEKELHSGYVSIRFGRTPESEVAFDMFAIGILQLAETFPEQVKVTEYGMG